MPDDYEKIKRDIEEKFLALLKTVFGADLSTVLLYGSAARGMYRKGVSDINILIILEKSSPRKIFELGKAAGSLTARHRITPLIMTRAEFASAADVFPMEYHDIRDSRRILFGRDEPADLELSRTNLRHQLEERLRGAVNDIRQMLILSGGREVLLKRFLKSWSGAQNSLFRGLLRLKGIETLPADAEQLLERTSSEYKITTSAFSDLNNLQRGGKMSSLEVADRLLESLKALAAAVDAMPAGGGDA